MQWVICFMINANKMKYCIVLLSNIAYMSDKGHCPPGESLHAVVGELSQRQVSQHLLHPGNLDISSS